MGRSTSRFILRCCVESTRDTCDRRLPPTLSTTRTHVRAVVRAHRVSPCALTWGAFHDAPNTSATRCLAPPAYSSGNDRAYRDGRTNAFVSSSPLLTPLSPPLRRPVAFASANVSSLAEITLCRALVKETRRVMTRDVFHRSCEAQPSCSENVHPRCSTRT
jgi:hypothetical protein